MWKEDDTKLIYKEGEIIFEDGTFGSEMYIIQSGSVDVIKYDDEKEIILNTLRETDFFGEMSLLEGLPRSATLRAREETHLLALNSGSLMLKLRRDPAFTLTILRKMGQRIRKLNNEIVKKKGYDEDAGHLLQENMQREDKLCIISDVHLGCSSFRNANQINAFIQHLIDNKINLCINGDGVDLMQFSFPKMMLELPTVFNNLNALVKGGNSIYYVVGNHDLYMERFLQQSGMFKVVPFVDIVSGENHIHIEHGHLHDQIFLKYTTLYIILTKVAGMVLKVCPKLYNLLNFWYSCKKNIKHYLPTFTKSKYIEKYLSFDDAELVQAGERILERGFDTVIFGHSHHFGMQEMKGNKIYANSGSWMSKKGTYIQIDHGTITLKEWV